jgi:RNA polymerase sigma factor (sigma-70 family)
MDVRLNQYEGLPDEEIVVRILNGDEWAAVYLLTVRCGPSLKYLAQFKYRSLNLEYDEAVNELFVHLRRNEWKALRDFRGANSAGRSCSVAHYVLFIAARWFQRKLTHAVKETAWLAPLDNLDEYCAVPADQEARQRLTEEVLEAVLGLENPSDRQALMLYKIEGRDVEEVARMMNTTPGNIYTRCSRAISRLRELIMQGEVHV